MSYSLVFTSKVQTTKEMENYSILGYPHHLLFEKSINIANTNNDTNLHTHTQEDVRTRQRNNYKITNK